MKARKKRKQLYKALRMLSDEEIIALDNTIVYLITNYNAFNLFKREHYKVLKEVEENGKHKNKQSKN